MFEIDGVEALFHSSVRIVKEKTIYIDPYKINKNYNDADLILITHPHYDHFSIEDIKKVASDHTMIFTTKDVKEELIKNNVNEKNVIEVKPYENYQFEDCVDITTYPAYNTKSTFHPKKNGWVGFLIETDGCKYYITGDTDCIKEIKNIKCDVLFVPIGGTYTMNYTEAAYLTNKLKPKYVFPIHYGNIVGEVEYGNLFKDLIDKKIKCIL